MGINFTSIKSSGHEIIIAKKKTPEEVFYNAVFYYRDLWATSQGMI